MTSESKILTVSYGTFSCTLEGFDNPFDTMKAIAEYFRELAAQDRHFGAEPPPPDAAMLHRLAEKEVSRMAAAGVREETARLAANAAEAEAPAGPRIHLNSLGRRRVSRELGSDDAPADDEIAAPEPSLQDVIPDGVAAKLARIRQSVRPAPANIAVPFAPFAPEPDTAEDEVAEPAGVEPAMPEAAVADITEDVALSGDDFAEDVAELSPMVEVEADLAETEDATVEDVAADNAPVEDYAEAADEVEDQPAAPEVALADAFRNDAWHDAPVAGAVETEEELAEEALAKEELAEEELAEAEVMAAAEEAEQDVAPELADAGIAMDADLSFPDEDSATSEDIADLAELDGVEFDEASLTAALEDSLPEDVPADIALADAEVEDPLPEATATDVVAAEDMPEPSALIEAAEEPIGKAASRAARRVNSRVVRLHPDADALDAANGSPANSTRVVESSEASDEIARLMKQAEEVMAEDENRRRQEALSLLKAAVVSTEADRADIDFEAPKADADLDPYRGDLAEAIEPEATEPAKGPAPEVRPRRKTVSVRPQEPRPGTIRPGMISPPPLVLVSEQRIDRVPPPAAPSMTPAVPGIGPAIPEGQPMVALRTGRLSGAIGAGASLATSAAPARSLVLDKPSYGPAAEAEEDEELSEDVKEIDEAGFAAFAETVGAKSMADLLEAAAAYATCVEKRSQFTRPQLMRRMMASAGGSSVSREDGLRSFGTLLRTGRIEKINRGHYSLAENSPYLAEARRLN
jgi:hypothetical protein